MTSGIVLCFGFGALNVFTLLGIGQARLPGLYTFRAATVGDDLLLPLLAYSLVRSAGLQRRSGTSQAVLSRAGAILGASAGTAVQVYALADPDPRLDWTFPAPHFYNLPGWYHTVFLIVASGFFGWSLGLVLARIREDAKRDAPLALRRIRSAGALGILTPGLAFLGLLIEDDLSGIPAITFTALASVTGFGVVACGILCLACGLRNFFRWCALTVLGSLLPAVALCVLFLPGHAASTAAVLSAGGAGLAVVSATLGVISPGSSRRPVSLAIRCCLTVCPALCAIGPAYAISTGGLTTAARVAAGCFAGLLLAGCELGILQAVLREQEYSG
ncbi:MAG TPA: hypothetical protein VFO01_02305 [Trebonia sp.]|nr:hypothetical protein [Trebonia sp.]